MAPEGFPLNSHLTHCPFPEALALKVRHLKGREEGQVSVPNILLTWEHRTLVEISAMAAGISPGVGGTSSTFKRSIDEMSYTLIRFCNSNLGVSEKSIELGGGELLGSSQQGGGLLYKSSHFGSLKILKMIS